MKTDIKVIILTNIDAEYDAVRQHLTNIRTTNTSNNTVYEIGEFILSNNQVITIAILKMGSGNSVAAHYTTQAIHSFEPNLIFLVGTAGGVKKVKSIGDIVIVTKAYNYETGRDKDEYFAANPTMYYSSTTLINIAEEVRRANKWQNRTTYDATKNKAFLGAVASGEQVIESSAVDTKASIYKRLKQYYSSAIAVEMESYGFLMALKDNQNIEKIVIKSISDSLDDKIAVNQLNSREMSSANASAFAYEMIDTYYSKKAIPIKKNKWSMLLLIGAIITIASFTIYQFIPNPKIIEPVATIDIKTVDSTIVEPPEEVLKPKDETPKTIIPLKISPKIPEEKPIITPTIRTFSIKGISAIDTIIQTIEMTPNWKFKKFKSDYTIEITYSNELIPIEEIPNFFRYNGGHIIVKIDGEICFKTEQFKLTKTLLEGNSKAYVEKKIAENIEKIILEHQILFALKIQECLIDISSSF